MFCTMCIGRGELGLLGELNDAIIIICRNLATQLRSGRLLIITNQITQKPGIKTPSQLGRATGLLSTQVRFRK